MTLRKFYLLMGEYFQQQRLEDARFYRLISTWCKSPPELAKLFPNFAINRNVVADDDIPDDLLTFQQVTASLTPYRE